MEPRRTTFRPRFAMTLLFVAAVSYFWGGFTVYKQIFPYRQIQILKNKYIVSPYDSSFFAARSAGSASSAAQILPEVVRLIAPKSAVDLGSGTGEWLGELRKLGVTD